MMEDTVKQQQSGNAALRILVVDDTTANLNLLRAALTKVGHSVITATSGEEGLRLFAEQQPDLVLMDVMMPGIGGIEATRRIRAQHPLHWVPIIFISALDQLDDMVRGLEAGGDDYLAKPVDLKLLMAKIRAMQRISVLERSLSEANAELSVYHEASERDLDMARELMERVMTGSSMQVRGIESWVQPTTNLSGDMVITQRYLADRDYMLCADAMGHGLPAALPLMPLAQVFAAMTQKGFTVSAIAREMNVRLRNLLPVGNFVAVTLLSVDRANRVMELWNGGSPDALLLDAGGNVVRRLKSRHPAIGVLNANEFDASTETLQWNGESWLMCHTDGLTDASNAQGEEFGMARVLASLQGGDPFQSLRRAVTGHLDGHAAHDDISLVAVSLDGAECV
ncbi:MAG: fused response regulator/phosphatase [Nitrosomonadales bacterium]|nr:fused response regulator/phosphatase [Nitrosomonadales bacterium]